MKIVPRAIAAPLGDASDGLQVSTGFVKRPPAVDPRPSTSGQP